MSSSTSDCSGVNGSSNGVMRGCFDLSGMCGQDALAVLTDGVERDFRIIEGVG